MSSKPFTNRRCDMQELSETELKKVLSPLLSEDIGTGDLTSESIVPASLIFEGNLITKEEGIIAGMKVVETLFFMMDQSIHFSSLVTEGQRAEQGHCIAKVNGPARSILSAERTALNLLQRMSGIASLTHRFVKAVSATQAVILDTRKTAPGLRALDKWAVRSGGGQNHRHGLFDMILIKENHVTVAGSITKALNLARQRFGSQYPIEIEVKNLQELEEALRLNPDRILLDNMESKTLRKAVRITAGAIPLEASGKVSLQNVREIAETGVDFISVGALTHSVRALDISLILE